MNIETFSARVNEILEQLLRSVTSSEFHIQVGLILLSLVVAFSLSLSLKKHSPVLNKPPESGNLLRLRKNIYALGDLLFPFINVITLGIAVNISESIIGQSWLMRIAVSLAILLIIYMFLTRFIQKSYVKGFVKWIILPVAMLQVFGVLDEVSDFLKTISVDIGSITISAYGFGRLLVFGAIIFWIGRISNNVGTQLIRSQDDMETGTREVFAKLFEVTVFVLIFILLLQLLGINITALAIFGGALGVGLGFGLQSIASNFVSGIIILLDRSIAVGDYIQLEDGPSGKIRELNMRSAILETYDGKDIMVPNEKFITTNFVNWTHKNLKQRYPLNFTVSYDTDLDLLFEVVRETVASHPQVISGDDLPIEERPDAEIAGFGESGIDILVEFWMEGVDDGENRVGADLLHMIWNTLKEHDIEIPYPHRDVRIIGGVKDLD